MGWVQGEQAGAPCHVHKSAVAVIAQQRVWHAAFFPHPSTAQNEQIDIAVVVVVGLFEIDPPYLTVYPGRCRGLGKRAIALVVEVAQWIA